MINKKRFHTIGSAFRNESTLLDCPWGYSPRLLLMVTFIGRFVNLSVVVFFVIVAVICTLELTADRTIREICVMDIDVVILRVLHDRSDQIGVYITDTSTGGATSIWWGERDDDWTRLTGWSHMNMSSSGRQRNVGGGEFKSYVTL